MTLWVSKLYSVDGKMINEYGAVGEMRIDWENRSTLRKPAPVTLCPPKIPQDLGLNPSRRGAKPVNNLMSYNTAHINNTFCKLRNLQCFNEI
jgi:hypothetical protein